MIATVAMIAAIVAIAIAEKNSSAIVAICGFHMIAAIATIAEKVKEGRGDLLLTQCSRHLSNSTWRLWIVDSCLKVGFLYSWVLFNVNDEGKDKELITFGFERSSRRGNFGILLSATQCILVLLLSLRSLWSLRSLESGFYMIAGIATITEIQPKSISAIVVAAIATLATLAVIAGEWFHMIATIAELFFSDRSDRSDLFMETSLKQRRRRRQRERHKTIGLIS